MAEWQILLDPVGISFMNQAGTAQTTAAFWAFGLAQVSSAGTTAQHFAGCGHLEPLGDGLFRFDAFGTSHKLSFLEKSAHYR